MIIIFEQIEILLNNRRIKIGILVKCRRTMEKFFNGVRYENPTTINVRVVFAEIFPLGWVSHE